MRIGLFSDTYLPDINGVVTSIETLRLELVSQGHEVFVVANHSSLLSLKYENNLLLLPGIELKFLFDYNMSGPINFTAMEVVKGMNLDVIHVHTEFGVGIFARICARTLNIPLVYTYHTTYEDYTHYVNFFHSKAFDKVAKRAVASLSKMLANPASILITPSLKTKKMLQGYGIDRPMHVIPTGINLERFDASELLAHQRKLIRHNYQIPESAKVFIFVGRIAEEKNIQLVLNAFEKLVTDNTDLYLLIVGAGPDSEKVNNWISEHGLNQQIISTGRIENSQIAGFYHSADAFVSASMSETQGLTYIEAMACGLPIFASDMNVLSELLYEKETGYFFDDEATFIKKVEDFLALDQNQYESLSQKAKACVKPYDARLFGESIIKVYQQAIDNLRQSFSVESIQPLINSYYVLKLSSAASIQQSIVVNQEQVEQFSLKEDRILDQKLLQQLIGDEPFNRKYQVMLDRLTYRDYSKAQVAIYLENRFPQEESNQYVIDILIDKGLVNDERLIDELITRSRQKGNGYYRILKTLDPYQFDKEVLNKHLLNLESSQRSDCEEALQKHKDLAYQGSKAQGLQRLCNKLIRDGFESRLVNECIERESFDFDEDYLFDSCYKEYDRLHRRFIRQHDSRKAQQKVIQSLLAKGFTYDMIMQVEDQREEEKDVN